MSSAITNNQLKKKFLKSVSATSILSIASMALLYISQVLIARLLGTEQFGIYHYTLSWLTIAVLFSKLGQDTTLQRFMPEYSIKEKWALCKGLLLGSFKISAFSTTTIVLLSLTMILVLQEKLEGILFDTFMIGILMIPLWALNKIIQGALIAFKKPALSIIPDGLILPGCLMISFLILHFITRQNIYASTAIFIHAILLLVILCISLIFLYRYALTSKIYNAVSEYRTKNWLYYSFPLVFISGTQLILNHADIIMIGLYVDTTNSGIYAAATRISTLVTMGLLFINMILTPYISEYFHNQRRESLQMLVTYSTRIASLFALPVFTILFFYGDSILWLFGETFTVGHKALIILGIGALCNVFSGSVGFLMSMTGHQIQSAYIFGIACLLNILLNILLIPTFGIEGAAVATCISMIFWNITLALYLKMKININSTILTR